MSKKSRVSVVIRTRNESLMIGKVLRSLSRQTHKNIEIVVVDSGSTDKTKEIVRKFPVKLIEIKPQDYTPGYALNKGIINSEGKYIAIICGHSLPISNSWLADGLANFKSKKVAAVTGWVNAFPLGYINRLLGRILFQPLIRTRKNAKKLNKMSALIRKDLWKDYPFDEKITCCEDLDWGQEMIARGYGIVKDKKFSVFHSSFFVGKTPSLFKWPEWNRVEREILKEKRRPQLR